MTPLGALFLSAALVIVVGASSTLHEHMGVMGRLKKGIALLICLGIAEFCVGGILLSLDKGLGLELRTSMPFLLDSIKLVFVIGVGWFFFKNNVYRQAVFPPKLNHFNG